jgi:hypothetical protein
MQRAAKSGAESFRSNRLALMSNECLECRRVRLIGFHITSWQKEIVVFHFQNESCDSGIGKFGYGWNVPPGTVTIIAVIPRGTHRLEEYKSGTNFKVDDHGGGFVYYTDVSAGLTIETYKNFVTLVEYHAEGTQENLRCPRVAECCIDFFSRFDEYAKIPLADEKARLDNFLFQVNAGFGRGTIEVLGPSPKERQRRLKLAARAKRYLVRVRGLEPERLLLLDGGYHQIDLTRLATYSIGGAGSRIYLSPQKDPENTPPASRRQTRQRRRV